VAARHSEPARIETFALLLKALGHPLRIQILEMLRIPHTLAEMRLTPERKEGGAKPSRSMSRMAVRQHVDQLLDFGLVRQVRVLRQGRSSFAYVVNHRQLFAVTEELKELARIRPDQDLLVDGTRPGREEPVPERVGGPRLVLVNGIYEGTSFPLRFEREAAHWRIGRKRGLAVSLDYDPYLSLENSEITWDKARYFVRDLPGSRNGTAVNWLPLEPGGTRELVPGDIVSAGRSLLLFTTS
jgi:DNA-binding transcriptional ArsR family regulator